MDTPQLDKLLTSALQRATLADFLDWLKGHPNFALGMWIRTDADGAPLAKPRLIPAYRSADGIIYEFLGIDPVELERERRAILAAVQTRKEG